MLEFQCFKQNMKSGQLNTAHQLSNIISLCGPWEYNRGMTHIRIKLPTSHGYILTPHITTARRLINVMYFHLFNR